MSAWPQPRAEDVNNYITPTCSHGTVSHIKSVIEIMQMFMAYPGI